MLNAKMITLCAAICVGSAAARGASLPLPESGQQVPTVNSAAPGTGTVHPGNRFTTHDAYRIFIQVLAAEAVHTERDTLVSNYMDRTKLDASQSQQLIALALDADQQITQNETAENQVIKTWIQNYPTAAERRASPLPSSAKTLGSQTANLVDKFQATLKNTFTTDDFNKVNLYITQRLAPDRKPERKQTPPAGFVSPSTFLPGTSEIRVQQP